MSVSFSLESLAERITGCLEEARFTLVAAVSGGVSSAGSFGTRLALLPTRYWRVTGFNSAGTMAAGFVSEGCRSPEPCCRDAGRGESRCADIPSNKPIAITPAKVAGRQNILSFVKIGGRKSLEIRTLRIGARGPA